MATWTSRCLESEQEQRNSGWSRSAHTPIKRISEHRDTISCHPLCCTNDLIDMKGRCCPKIVVSIPRSLFTSGQLRHIGGNIGKESFLFGMIYIRKSSYPFHWFISSVGIPLSSSHIRPFTLLFRLSLHNQDTPQLTLASGVKRSGWQAANEQSGCQICLGFIYISCWIYK